MKGECDSLTGSYLISLLITAACSNLNEESRVSREPTLASRGVTSKIVQNKMPHSLDWNRDFRYRRNSGATMWMRGESPAGLFNALTMTVL